MLHECFSPAEMLDTLVEIAVSGFIVTDDPPDKRQDVTEIKVINEADKAVLRPVLLV